MKANQRNVCYSIRRSFYVVVRMFYHFTKLLDPFTRKSLHNDPNCHEKRFIQAMGFLISLES